MDALIDVFRNSDNALSCAWQVLRHLGSFIWLLLLTKAVLAARVLALQSQLAACTHRIDAGKAPRPRFNQAFRILWVILSKLLDRWEDLAQVMQPATVRKWHTAAFRSYWRSSTEMLHCSFRPFGKVRSHDSAMKANAARSAFFQRRLPASFR